MSATRNKRWIIPVVILAVIVLTGCAFWVYTTVYYHADTDAINAYLAEHSDVTIHTTDDGTMIFEGKNVEKGNIIFYPGGKVEYTAYQSLMVACAEQGYRCYLVEMPFNLAVLDVNAADGIITDGEDVAKWYLAGHSLGGTIAANYAAKHGDKIEGLRLLGAYSTQSLTDSGIAVLSIYGSNDGVMNHDKYESCRSNYPSEFREYVIAGGCHAYFGLYGYQKGDGTPTITPIEQIERTAEIIANTFG